MRIAAKADTKLSVAMPELTLAGTTATMDDDATIPLTTDTDGNAYLYGTWTADATLTVKDVPAEGTQAAVIASKTLTAANAAGKSYALAAYTKYDDRGTGTEAAPYEIYTAAQLQSMSTANITFEGKYIKLMSDIDCYAITDFTPIGSQTYNFAGTFNGGNHTISNLEIGKNGLCSGLFSIVNGATISDLTLLDPTSNTDAYYAGALAGASSATTKISNCHVKLTSGSSATIASSYSSSYSSSYIGGLVGDIPNGTTTLLGCSSDIPVRCTNGNVGGLVGRNNNTLTIAGCRATGATNGGNVGGLLGWNAENNLTIVGSYATGTATGSKSAGGLVGLVNTNSNDIKILSSYATGEPSTATNVGSLVGNVEFYKYFSLYYVGSTTSIGNAGNGVGNNDWESLHSEGVELGKSAGDLDAVIVNPNAEAKWSETGFATLKALLDGKTLSQIWKDNGSAAPTLWWEQ